VLYKSGMVENGNFSAFGLMSLEPLEIRQKLLYDNFIIFAGPEF